MFSYCHICTGCLIDASFRSFNDVHALLVKQAGRPFLKRYLKRDEISKQLHQCDVGLQEALGMFSVSTCSILSYSL